MIQVILFFVMLIALELLRLYVTPRPTQLDRIDPQPLDRQDTL